jgi:DNA (cytosine-5)-methyltransferase 1
VGDAYGNGTGKHAGELPGDEGEAGELAYGDHSPLASGAARLLGDPSGEGLEGRESEPGDDGAQREAVERAGGATGGFWADAEWIYCRDGKWRPVESKYEQVADGLAGDLGRVRAPVWPLSTGELSRVGRIKGYGNAIVAPLAATFIRAFMDVVAADA